MKEEQEVAEQKKWCINKLICCCEVERRKSKCGMIAQPHSSRKKGLKKKQPIDVEPKEMRKQMINEIKIAGISQALTDTDLSHGYRYLSNIVFQHGLKVKHGNTLDWEQSKVDTDIEECKGQTVLAAM